jgi:hypothetical protein
MTWVACLGRDRYRARLRHPPDTNRNTEFDSSHLLLPFPLICRILHVMSLGLHYELTLCPSGYTIRSHVMSLGTHYQLTLSLGIQYEVTIFCICAPPVMIETAILTED